MSDDDALAGGLRRMVDAAVQSLSQGKKVSLVHGAVRTLFDIDVNIKTMERAPAMYGAPEAFEFQFLMLIETRQQLLRPVAHAADVCETRDAYLRFIRAVNGEDTNTYLHCILREAGMLDHLPRLMGDFGRWVAQKYPPEVIGGEGSQ